MRRDHRFVKVSPSACRLSTHLKEKSVKITGKRVNKAPTPAAYKNAKLPAEKRIKDLLSSMTLEEKAAQMMCIWQEKAQKLVDADGNFDLEKAKAAFKNGTASARSADPAMPARRQECAPDGRAHQRHPELLPGKQPPRHSCHLSRRMPARPRCHRRHQLSAADRARRHVQPGSGRVSYSP